MQSILERQIFDISNRPCIFLHYHVGRNVYQQRVAIFSYLLSSYKMHVHMHILLELILQLHNIV
jgi:hypothetical protein